MKSGLTWKMYARTVFNRLVRAPKSTAGKLIGFLLLIPIAVLSILLFPVMKLIIKAPAKDDPRAEYIYPMF